MSAEKDLKIFSSSYGTGLEKLEIDIDREFRDNKYDIKETLRGITWVCAKRGRKDGLYMRRIGNRLLCGLLAAALLLAVCPLNGLAAEDLSALPVETEIERTSDGEGGYEAMVENRETLGEGIPFVSEAPDLSVPSAALYDGGDIYSQLSTRAKACYRALEDITIDRLLTAAQVEYQNEVYRRALVQVQGITGVTMTGRISGGQFYPSSASASTESGIYTDLCAAIVALRYDRPDILWMRSMRYGYKITQTSSGSARITDVMFDFYLEYGGREKLMRDTMLERARSIAAQAEAAADTYTRVGMIHDILVEGNTYGDADASLAHTAYSALLFNDEYEPVCEGYAKAFKIVCDYLDLPCVLASSVDHMWNNVKMDDGEWYNMDLTWDDDDEEDICRDYFLIGSQTVVDGKAFSEQTSHIEENPYDPYLAEDRSGLLKRVTLRFPAKNSSAYVYLGTDYPPSAFSDVRRRDYYYDAVQWAAEQGIAAGISDTQFGPGRSCTRAQTVTFLWRAAGEPRPQSGVNPFTDIKPGDYYYDAVLWAVENNITVGTSATRFSPNATVTRGQTVAFLYRAANSPSVEEPNVFEDVKETDYFADAVRWAAGTGVTAGTSETRFSPGKACTRCEIVTFIYRDRVK